MDSRIEQALASERTIDITTTGRRSGEPRRIEIWFHRIDGRYYITGTPGTRDWYANLLAEPRFTFHLKGDMKADLPARATPVTGPADKERVLRAALAIADRVDAEWIERSPLVEVEFEQG